MRRRPGRPALRGFTLIELVIAAALLALLAAVGHIALVQTLRAQEAAAQSVDALARLQRAVVRLDREFDGVAPRGVRSNAGFLTAPFVADEQSVEFTTNVALPGDTPVPRGHLLRVRYRVGDGMLLRDTWPVLDRAGDSEARTAKLLDAFDDARFRFMTPAGDWVTRWPDGESALSPVAVELTARLAGRGVFRRLWHLAG